MERVKASITFAAEDQICDIFLDIFFSEIKLDISFETSAGRGFTGNIKAYLGN